MKANWIDAIDVGLRKIMVGELNEKIVKWKIRFFFAYFLRHRVSKHCKVHLENKHLLNYNKYLEFNKSKLNIFNLNNLLWKRKC